MKTKSALFVIHYDLRKGLGPEWIKKTEEIFLDDLSLETDYEIKEMAKAEFKERRYKNGTHENSYLITEIEKI